MSRMTFAPFVESAVHAFQMRDHRFSLAPNLLPKHPSAQAPRSCSDKRASKSNASGNARAVTHLMPTSVRKVAARRSTAAPRAVNEVERIANAGAVRANHAPPEPALPALHDRHRPLAERDLGLD